MSGLEGKFKWGELFDLPKDYWVEDVAESRTFLETEVNTDLPEAIRKELVEQEKRVAAM